MTDCPKCAKLADALRWIADHAPSFSEDAETLWSNRMWASAARDLQRIARAALKGVEP